MNNEFLKWFEAEEGLKDTVYSSTSSKINVTQAMGRISRDSHEKIIVLHPPDGTHSNPDATYEVIDKDLLQEIRDLVTLCTLIDKSGQCKAMSDKLDKIYPFLC